MLPLIWLIKLVTLATRLRGHGGAALPGLVAERLNPQVLAKLGHGLDQGIVLITGTNGKTTTTKLTAAILQSKYSQIAMNRTGSNLSRGIISALVANMDWRGRPRARFALLEVDEASMPRVAEALQPSAIVVLNLFRDQLDRYGELDRTAALLGSAIAATQAELILNSDDPLVAQLAQYASDAGRVSYFGLESAPQTPLATDRTADSSRCPACGRPLDYSQKFFSHLGHYACPEDHIKRPQPQITARVEKLTSEQGQFNVSFDGHSASIKLPLGGLYNIYNALAALSIGVQMGGGLEPAAAVLARAEAAFGRVERLRYRDRELYLLLIKNPTGFTQVLQTFLLPTTKPRVLMAINDNFADGRDVSWLWDVPLEELQALEPIIMASGIRAADLQLRLKYAELAARRQEDVMAGLDELIQGSAPNEVIYVLPTYTAMLELRRRLGRETELMEVRA